MVRADLIGLAYQFAPPTPGTTSYVPNGLNQYASVTPPGGSATTMGYDADGNLTSDGTFSYSYDPENRLTGASETGMSAQYLYDPAGRRREKTVTGGSYAGTTQYLDAGNDNIAEYDGSGTLLRRYIPGPGIDQPIAMITAAGAITYFHRDKSGSVVAMSDASGNLTEGPYTYDAYGDCVTGGIACASGEPFKYTGQRQDPETGLYYYRARYYSPLLGRFLQTDPIGYADDINWYAYAANDPTNKNDPSGEDSSDCGDHPCIPKPPVQQKQDERTERGVVGKTTVGALSRVLTNEIGSLSTPKGGDPKELEEGASALANTLINNAEKARPNQVAPDTGTASPQLSKAMRDAYTNRVKGGVDPVHGRTFYGTSHISPDRLHSRPIGNSRQSVYAHFGPFKDSISPQQTYIYIYNDPGY